MQGVITDFRMRSHKPYCQHDSKSECVVPTPSVGIHRLNRNMATASALKHRKANPLECFIAREFWKYIAKHPGSKHKKKMAVKELGRVNRIGRIKVQPNDQSTQIFSH